MLVVSDTSPISSLIQIDRAELLVDLFGAVCVPAAVGNELKRFHSAIPPFVELRHVSDRTRVELLQQDLDLGEAEAIVLAGEIGADYLLMDERRGRIYARQAGITVIGLLGALLLAKQRGLIASVKECILHLRDRAGFYVSEPLIEKMLRQAGE
jgi:predicted nucleic acid-binding protein